MKVGILDLKGSIEETVALAPLADSLGYSRYWIAEHSPQPTPLLVVSIIAGITENLRVGTAGILFHYYPPLRTAHDFQFLERVYEGRIDAGFCAGIADATLIADDLEGRDPAALIGRYHKRVETLVRHLRTVRDVEASTRWHDAPEEPPQIWYLGGSPQTGAHAGKLGVHFAYAFMFPHSRDDPAGIAAYRESFVKLGAPEQARAVVSVAGVCAATDAEAKAIAELSRGKFFVPMVVGEPARCADELRAIRERFDADEIVFADLCHGLEARSACYELLAGALFE